MIWRMTLGIFFIWSFLWSFLWWRPLMVGIKNREFTQDLHLVCLVSRSTKMILESFRVMWLSRKEWHPQKLDHFIPPGSPQRHLPIKGKHSFSFNGCCSYLFLVQLIGWLTALLMKAWRFSLTKIHFEFIQAKQILLTAFVLLFSG